MTSFWHPFADMAAVEAGGGPSSSAAADRTSGTRRATGTWIRPPACGSATSGTGGPRSPRPPAPDGRDRLVLDVRRTDQPSTEALAERVAGLAPMPGAKVFLTSGGSDRSTTADQDRAPLLVARRRARPDDPDPARTRVSRDARGRDLALGDPREPGGIRFVAAGRGRGPVGRRGGAPVHDRPGRRGPRSPRSSANP